MELSERVRRARTAAAFVMKLQMDHDELIASIGDERQKLAERFFTEPKKRSDGPRIKRTSAKGYVWR